METRTLQVNPEDTGTRLDAWLAGQLPDVTRSAAARLCEEGRVTAAGKPLAKNYRLGGGEAVSVTLPDPEPVDVAPQDIPLDVVYEDSDVIVVNKPKGMVVHPAPGNPDGTLVNALLYHCAGRLSSIGGVVRPGIVHRIDKDTSGLLVVAKDDVTHTGLSEQMAVHSINRVYQTVVYGGFAQDEGFVEAPIGRHKTDRKKMAVTEQNSKYAYTAYHVLGRYQGFSHLECRLKTGRTHQIRVHMGYLGYPLPADYLYCPDYSRFSRQPLHSVQIEFSHPITGRQMCLTAPVPQDMAQEFL